MEILKTVVAGTLESSDIMVTLETSDGSGIQIELQSTVEKQFGDEIRQVIADILSEMAVQNAKVTAVDKGALNCTIRARVKTAIVRASNPDVEGEDAQ